MTNFFQILGGTSGFLLWLTMLESDKMKGVIYRKNENGDTIFTPHNILSFMIAPFKHTYFWTSELILHNWIIVVFTGAIVGTIIGIFTNTIFYDN